MTTTQAAVTWSQALAWRLERKLLAPVGDLPVADVVGRLGAVLSVDPAAADLAVRSRCRAAGPGDLAAALGRGDVVEVFAFRGGLHLLTPASAAVFLAVRCAGRQWELPSWQEHYGLTPDAWPAFRAAVREAVAGGPLTVPELGAALTAQPEYRHLARVFEDGPWTLLKPLTWQGDVSLGPRRDGRPTLQGLDRNPSWTGLLDLDDAGRAAVVLYLSTYGPASEANLRYWLCEGLSAGTRRLRGWLADLGDRTVTVDVEGEDRLVLSGDVDALLAARPTGAVHLLPGHDQWVMGPGTKETHVVPPSLRPAVTAKANLVVVDGVVRGTWTASADDVTVTGVGSTPEVDAAVDRLSTLRGPMPARAPR